MHAGLQPSPQLESHCAPKRNPDSVRTERALIGKASGVYIARGNDKLDMTASTLAGPSTVSGIVIAKGNTALHEALRFALESALADGSYAKVMADFGVPEGVLTLEQIRNPSPA